MVTSIIERFRNIIYPKDKSVSQVPSNNLYKPYEMEPFSYEYALDIDYMNAKVQREIDMGRNGKGYRSEDPSRKRLRQIEREFKRR